MSEATRRSSAGDDETHDECSSDVGGGHGQTTSNGTQGGEKTIGSEEEHRRQTTNGLRRTEGETSDTEEALEQRGLRRPHGRNSRPMPPPAGPRGGSRCVIAVDGNLDLVNGADESRSLTEHSTRFARPPRAAVRPPALGGVGGAGMRRCGAATAEREELQAVDDYALAPQYGVAMPGDDAIGGADVARIEKDTSGTTSVSRDAGAWSCGRASPTECGGDMRRARPEEVASRADEDQKGWQDGTGTGLMIDAVERGPKRRRLRGKQPTVGPTRHQWPNSVHADPLYAGAAASRDTSGVAQNSSGSSSGVGPSRFTTATCTWDRLAVECNRDGRGLNARHDGVEDGWVTRGGRPPDVVG